MQNVIDLRSDTVTQPTPDMRRAMYEAEVGDDYYRADPTVCALEDRAADMLGKEAAMLVLSGTMGNLVSFLAQTNRGESIIVEETSHVFRNEAGNLATVCGVTAQPVKGHRGLLGPEHVTTAIFPAGIIHPATKLLSLENTHNAAGGLCLSVERTQAIAGAAKDRGLAIHLDGARVFNAAVALGVRVDCLVAPLDSVTFCLTKGLACPVGSIVAGSRDFVAAARHWRQMVGGGMRQAGVFAAAGLVALNQMIDRLAEDHANAKLLAVLLRDAGLPVDPDAIETNMVFVDIPEAVIDAQAFVEQLKEEGVVIQPPKVRRVRFVTHYGIEEADIRAAGERVARQLDRHRMRSA